MIELDKVNYVFSNLSSVQLQVFKGLDGAQIQNYITQLQTIKAASKGLYAPTPVSQYASAIKDLEAKQAALLLSTQGLTNAQIAETLAVNESNVATNYQAMADAGLLSSKQKLTLAQLEENLQTVLGSEADAKAAISAMNLTASTQAQTRQTVKLSAAKLEEAVDTNILTEAQAKEFAMRTGVMFSRKSEASNVLPKWITKIKAATKAVGSQVKATAKWLKTAPAGWATAAIAGITGVIAVMNHLEKAQKKESDDAIELYEHSKEKIQSNKEEAKSLEDLAKRYQELKPSSDMDTETREQIKEIQYEIVDLVGSEAETLDLVNGKLDDQLAKLKEITAEKLKQNVQDAADAYDNSKYTSDVMVGDADDYGNDVSIKWDGSEATQIHNVEGFEHITYQDFMKFITNNGFGDIFRENKDGNLFNMRFVVDTTGIDGLEEKVARLQEFKEFLASNGLRSTGLYQNVTSAIDRYEEQDKNEFEAANNLLGAVVDHLSASNKELKGITVDSADTFEQYRKKMIGEVKADESVGRVLADGVLSETDLEAAVNNFMSTASQFSEWYEQWENEIHNVSSAEPISFSSHFKNLWDSEDFSSARSDLISLSKEAGITENDIISLASENETLAALLEDSGISAQFAAKCFERAGMGEDGFSAITEDVLALDKALHGMDESLEAVSQAKSKYDKAISRDDYNTEFENYQEAYQSAMEMFENGEYGKHFRSTMEYLLGDDSYTMGIDEMYEAMKNLKSVFGENGTNGLEFLDKLYNNKDALDGLGSSLEKLSDGTYNYNLKPEDFEAIGEAVGMTAEEVAACTNALGMFGNHVSYDIGEVENKLKDMSISAEGSKDAFLSLQGMESILSNLGYNGYEVYHIMEQIKGMGSINLIDFSASDEESINKIVSQLKELDMLEIDGKNINVDSLIENLETSLHMTSDDIETFIKNLSSSYDFTDSAGNIVSQTEAVNKAQQSELGKTKEAADSLAESVDDVNTAVDLLNNKKLVGVNEEFGALKGAVSAVTEEVGLLTGKVDELSEKMSSINFGGIQKVQEITSRTLGTNTGKPGNKTGKQNPQGMAKAAGTGNIGIKKTETALINELGHETIIDPKKGTYEIVQGGAQFRELKKGQIVLNHKQTEGLLRNGKIATFGKMFFRGNADLEGSSYASGSITSRNPGTGKKWHNSGNSGNSSGNSSRNSNTDSSSTDKDKQPSLEIFDFIEIAISRIEDAIGRLKEKAEETFRSFASRGKAYADTIKKTTDEMNLQWKAYYEYIEKANSFGLDESYASQVRDGSLKIEDIEDDNLKEQIRNYQEWYNKAYECLQTIEELKKTQQELAREKIELSVTEYDKKNSRAEANVERIQNYVDLKEAYGGHARDVHYKGMNKYTKEQIDYTIKQNHSLKELQKTVTKGSEAWYEYQEQIDSNNNSIKQLTKSMAENAAAAASIAGLTAERKNGKEDTADQKIDAKLSTSSNNERTKQLLRSKITNVDDRQDNLGGAYTSSIKSRKTYGKKILNASTKGVSKKNKKLFTTAISCVKSKKSIPTQTINDIVNALKTAKGAEYKSLSKLLTYCNYYNSYKNAEEENKLNYQMYALTAQADKKELREEQLQSNLDHNQKKSDRNTMSIAETAAGKRHNANTELRLANANATSYKNSREKSEADRDAAGKKADFSSSKSYKKLKNKKLKGKLKKVVSAVKSGTKISKDGMDAVSEYCKTYLNGDMTYYYNCEAYNESVENVLSAQEAETLANAEAYAAKLQARFDKTNITVSDRDSKNEFYAAKAKNQTTAKNKNKYIDNQSKNIDKNLKSYKDDYTYFSSNYNTAKGKVTSYTSKDKSKQKIIDEIKAKYISKNSIIPPRYIEKAYGVSNDFGLACESYNEALDAKNASKEAYDLYTETSKTEKAALSLEKMSNIETEYSNKQGVYEQKSKQINSAMDLVQAKGYNVSTKFYDKLINEENKNNDSLVDERKKLVDSLKKSISDGSITKYSDEWYEACGKIDNVTNAIDESTKALVEFQNQIRQIEWDNFDYLQGLIKNVTSEIQFMVDELSREKMSSEELGWMTEYGEAAAHLHALSYSTYQKQAEDYKNEIQKINKDLSKDPYNKTLLERREALIQSYQDSIKGAQDEKYAVIDLYKQGYEALSAKIQKLISDYGELLDAEKNAYDYQDTISGKTKETAQIKKQLAAYAGDTSEETKAKLQTLTVSLEEAEKDLAETQYDKYISDTKEMLSEMQEDMDVAIQEIIDSLSKNFKKLIDKMGTNSEEACKTITKEMKGIGYTSTKEFQELINESSINTSITSINSSVTNMIQELKNYHAKMKDYADKLVSSVKDGTGGDDTNTSDPGLSYYSGGVKKYGGVKGYKTGSKSIPYDQFAFLGEEGDELQFDKSEGVLRPVGEGDMVFTAEQARTLWELTQKSPGVAMPGQNLPNVLANAPSVNHVSNSSMGDVNINFGDITLPNVTNSPEFAKTVEKTIRNAMCENGKTKKCVVESVASSLVGNPHGMERLWR